MSSERPYVERFSPATQVRVADRETLERFRAEWKYHNPLTPEQLGYAGRTAVVRSVSFYHSGDPLYVLESVPGVWHEACLVSHGAPRCLTWRCS
jgi:hypothetical protein